MHQDLCIFLQNLRKIVQNHFDVRIAAQLRADEVQDVSGQLVDCKRVNLANFLQNKDADELTRLIYAYGLASKETECNLG